MNFNSTLHYPIAPDSMSRDLRCAEVVGQMASPLPIGDLPCR